MNPPPTPLGDSPRRGADALLAALPGVLYTSTTTGRLVACAGRPEDLFGRSAAHLLAEPDGWAAAVHPDDLATWHRSRAVTADSPPYHLEYRVRDANGTWRWLEDRATRIEAEGTEVRISGFAQDVTARHTAEPPRSPPSPARIVATAPHDAVPISLGTYDATGRLVRLNEAGVGVFGLPHADAVLGRDLFSDPSITPEFAAALRRGETVRYRTHYDFDAMRRHGHLPTQRRGIAELDISIEPIAGRGGFQVLVQDITDRRRAVEALRRSEARLRTILETAIDGFWLADPTGRLLHANRAFTVMSGFTEEEMRGKFIRDFEAALTPAEIEARIALIIAERSQRFETLLRRKDGSTFDVEVSASYNPGDDGHLSIFLRDITRRKRAEREQQANARRAAVLLELPRLAETLDEPSFLQRALELTEDVTGSRIAFLHLVHPNSAAVELMGWSRRTLEGPGPAASTGHYPIGQAGVWTDALQTREPVVINDYGAAPARHGLPDGHSPLLRLLSVPVIEDGQVHVILGVGNKATDYTPEDVQSVQLIGAAVWRIVHERRAQAALTTSHELIVKLTAQVPGALYQYQLFPDGRACLPFASGGISEIFEVAPDDLRRDASILFQRIHPADRKSVEESILRSARTLEAFRVEFRVDLPRQGLRWRQAHSQPERRPDGSILWHGMVMDTTASKATEAALRESEVKLRLLFEQAPDAIFVGDTETGRITQVNEAACALLGRSREELLALHHWEVHPPASQAEARRLFSIAVRTGPGQRLLRPVELDVQRCDGCVLPVEILAHVVEVGGQRMLMAICRDLSARRAAEAAQRESEEKFGTIFKVAPVMMTLSDRETGACIDANDAMIRRSGIPREELLGRSSADAGWIDAPTRARLRQELATHGRVAGLEMEATTRGGEKIVCLYFAEIIRVGGRQQVLSIAQDISDLKRSEAALRGSEMRFRRLFDGAVDAVFVHDLEGRILDVNLAACRSLGYTREELLRLNVAQIEGTFAPDKLTPFWRMIAPEAGATIRGLHRRKDGTSFPVEVHIAPFGPGGDRQFFAAARDITERQAAERTLRLQSGALEAAANAVVITDAAGRVEWVNAAFTTLSGWPLIDCIGRRMDELLGGTLAPAEFDRIWTAVHRGEVWRGEVTNTRRDGRRWTGEMTLTPLRDHDGEISHCVAIKQDISDRKLMEARFLQAQRMEAMGNLAGGIAHDLNNILSPIVMIASLLRTQLADREHQELMEMVHREARRGGDIIKQLLTFSRGLGGDRTVVQMRYVIAELVRMLRETLPREIVISYRWDPGVWPVLADQTQMHQIALNLCINARDAMPEGGRLEIHLANATLTRGDPVLPPGAEPGPYLILEVRDTGVGIPADVREKIFEPFFTTKPLGKGTGLGLSTVLGIARGHDGFVTVESEPGRGSAFRIHLPAKPEIAAEDAGASPQETISGAGRLVLVVDDEENVRLATQVVLSAEGFTVCTAENGRDALQVFAAHADTVALVITDVMMPVMGGIALVRRLRELNPALPIIATSGLADTEKKDELIRLGVTQVLPKPASAEELLAAVQDALGGTHRR